MTSKYTVVQYLPDPTAGERINFGVIAWDAERARSTFVADWRRVRSFGREDTAFLREFADKITNLTASQMWLPHVAEEDALDRHGLERIIGNWSYSIQFTEPRGSVKGAQALLDEVSSTFLPQPRPKTRRGRSRRTAASQAFKFVFDAVQQQAPDEVADLVKANEILAGRLDEHRLDVVLENGKVFGAVCALSFEISDSDQLEREVDATAWKIDDVKRRYTKLPLAVYLFPPRNKYGQHPYERATRVFKGLKADVVSTEVKMGTWARQRAKAVAAA